MNFGTGSGYPVPATNQYWIRPRFLFTLPEYDRLFLLTYYG